MTQRLSDTINVLVPIGALGSGVRASDVEAGIAAGAHAIACDAGSTDSGPAYLATATSKYSRASVKHDLEILMRAQAAAGIPLLIGSCGTSGTDAGVDWTRDIALEVAREHGLRPRIAMLYSEQDPAVMAERTRRGEIAPLPPITSTEPSLFEGCDHIVALMGPEPYIAALEAGADIVLGGRTSDPAVLAAVPLARGAGAGPAWHAAKTAECGGLCTNKSRADGVLIRVGPDAFEVEPLADDARCTARTVSAHMLYENSDPFVLTEPGGEVHVAGASYHEVDHRVVRVEGSRFEPKPYTMKLEGASGGAFQTIMLIGIQDPRVLGEIDRFVARMQKALVRRVETTMASDAGDYDISLRTYGWNAVDGRPVASAATPREVGLMFVATAETQELATQIAKTCNPHFFHLPLHAEQELPSYAFAFSPAEIERGQVYEFQLNHVVRVEGPDELVWTVIIEAGATP
ncbi:MAG: acyclic terpene utilization AtuA family protein [Acidimicrobiales bacterium]